MVNQHNKGMYDPETYTMYGVWDIENEKKRVLRTY